MDSVDRKLMTSMSQLPDGIIDLIGKKMMSVEDFVRFGAVCKSWHSAVETRKKTQNVLLHPWLMLATYEHHKRGIQKFYSLSSKKTFKLKLPQIQGRRCFGTSFGWMVIYGLDLKIHLLNPFTGIKLPLPSQPTFGNQYDYKLTPRHTRDCFVHKLMATQLQTPESKSIIVMAVHSELCNLSFARPGDSDWTLVDGVGKGYEDAISYNDQIYAVNKRGDLIACEISDAAHSKATKVASAPEDFERGNKYYLVEINGALHFVQRIIEDTEEHGYKTLFFEVFEFDFVTKSWTCLDNLGDYALFFGTNTSYAIEICESSEFKPNCVYYTDDEFQQFERKYYDLGVYDCGKQTIETIYSGDHIWSHFSRPIFIRPCF
ncbi:SWR1-complex protein 3 [Ranunculus cassubicifolius]